MNATFAILALVTLAGALGAVAWRSPVHCALSATLSFAGVALIFLNLGAEFVGWAQILVYVGAVAVLIVFAILLTRSHGGRNRQPVLSRSWAAGLLVAGSVLGVMVVALFKSPRLLGLAGAAPEATVKTIGNELMTTFLLPLEVVGLLLTAAMIGAVIIAMREKGEGDR